MKSSLNIYGWTRLSILLRIQILIFNHNEVQTFNINKLPPEIKHTTSTTTTRTTLVPVLFTRLTSVLIHGKQDEDMVMLQTYTKNVLNNLEQEFWDEKEEESHDASEAEEEEENKQEKRIREVGIISLIHIIQPTLTKRTRRSPFLSQFNNNIRKRRKDVVVNFMRRNKRASGYVVDQNKQVNSKDYEKSLRLFWVLGGIAITFFILIFVVTLLCFCCPFCLIAKRQQRTHEASLNGSGVIFQSDTCPDTTYTAVRSSSIQMMTPTQRLSQDLSGFSRSPRPSTSQQGARLSVSGSSSRRNSVVTFGTIYQ